MGGIVDVPCKAKPPMPPLAERPPVTARFLGARTSYALPQRSTAAIEMVLVSSFTSMSVRRPRSRVMPSGILAQPGRGCCPPPRMAKGVPLVSFKKVEISSLLVGRKIQAGVMSLSRTERYEWLSSVYSGVPGRRTWEGKASSRALTASAMAMMEV